MSEAITQLDIDDFDEVDVDKLRDELAAVEHLLHTPGWAILVAYAKRQMASRTQNELRMVPADVSSFILRERTFGVVDGIELFIGFPEMLQTDMTVLLKDLVREENENA